MAGVNSLTYDFKTTFFGAGSLFFALHPAFVRYLHRFVKTLIFLVMDKIKNEKHNEKTADKAAAHKKQESCKDKGSCSTPKAENKTPKAHH